MSSKNAAETVLDTHLDETRLDASVPQETVLEDLPGSTKGDRAILKAGQTIANDYVVLERLSNDGKQADVYIARREGRQYVVKMYNRGHNPSEDLIKSLKGHTCPYVAGLLDYGYEGDTYYEIYDFYGKGTLEEKGKCSLSFIEDVFVPSINEGLHFLHTLNGKGIVHGDIKPRNIFVSDDESRVIIGDFGISSYLDENGKLIDDIKGTPEYAPRTVSFFGKTTKTPAYDYGALGLVLIKLATGHSIFEGLDMTAITQKWEKGIELPPNIDDRLKRLISGLLIEDEQRKFGYEEVKRWCEGEYVKLSDFRIRPEDRFEDEGREPNPLIFGIFNDKALAVSSLHELAVAIAEHWEHTKGLLKRNHLFEFIVQFDTDLEKKIREYSKLADEDKAVFYTLYSIEENPRLIYKGINYGEAKEFVGSLSSEITPAMQAIINDGLFEFFLKANGCEQELVEQVRRIRETDNSDPNFVPGMLHYYFNRSKEYKLGGKAVTSVDELADEILNMELDDIERAATDASLAAWLYSIGYKDDVLKFFKL